MGVGRIIQVGDLGDEILEETKMDDFNGLIKGEIKRGLG